jgi:hypothetical protein
MDLHQAPGIQPKFRRVSIIPPKLPLCWKDAIAPRVRGKPHRTSVLLQRAEWERVVEYRRRLRLALTLFTVAATLTLTDYVLAAEQMPAVTECIYLALYGVMTYFSPRTSTSSSSGLGTRYAVGLHTIHGTRRRRQKTLGRMSRWQLSIRSATKTSSGSPPA